jgi:hypothetical protein
MPEEQCPDKIRLIESFREANKAYALTIGELFAQVVTINKSRYEKLNDAVDRARAAAFEARAQLQNHIQEHQC